MDQQNVLSLSLAEYKEQIDSLYSSLSQLEQGTDEYKQVQESLNSALQAYAQVLNEATEQSNNLQASTADLNSELTNVQTTAENLNLGNETFQALADDLETVSTSFDNLSESENNLVDSTDNLTSTISNADSQFTTTASTIDNLQASADSLNNSLNNISSTSNNVTSSLNGASNQTSTFGNTADISADTIDQLNQNIQSLNDAVNSINQVTTGFNDLSNTLQDVNTQVQEFGEKTEEAGNKTKEAGDKIEAASKMAGPFMSVLGTLGVSTKELAVGFNLAENASKGLNSIWQVMAKHPFITIVSLLIGLFMKIKNAINSNEDAQKKWSVAMAKFQPIVDAVNKVLGWLAEILADVVSWIGDKIPSAITYVGKFISNFIRSIGNLISSFGGLVRIVPEVFDTIVDVIGDGVGTILNTIARLADAVGLDDFASSLRNAANAAKSFSLNATASLNSMVSSTVSSINAAASTVDNFFGGISKKFESAQASRVKYAKEVGELKELVDKAELANAETEKKVADLRNQAMQESDPAKRLEIYKKMNALIEENGKKQIYIAQRTYELEEMRQKFSPSSKEEKDYLNTLEANIAKTEATVASAQTKQIKMIKKLEDAQNAASKATTKTAKAEANKKVKAIEDELKAAIKASADFVKDFKDKISGISQSLSDELKLEESLKSIMETSGKFDLSAQIEYENKRYQLTVDANAKIKAEYEKALENEVLTEEDRLKLLSQYNSLIVQEQVDKNKHLAELNKITLTKINKETKEALESLNLEDVAQKQINSLVKAFAGLDAGQKAELLKSLSITEEEKNQILADIEVYEQDLLNGTNKYQELLETREHEHQLKMLEIKQANASKLLLAFGAENEQYLTAQAEYNQLMEEEEMRHATKMGEIKNKDKKATENQKKQNLKMYTEYAKALGSIMGGIADIMQNNIEQKRKEGKITEEEANKQFKKVKALQIAETIINTLAGAAGGYMQAVSTYPAPYGAILGGLTSAAALATGFAQIQKIRSTELGSSGSSASGGGGMSSVSIGDYQSMGVLPIVDENRDLANMQTIPVQGDSETEEKDTRVYILQSDITDSNNQVQIRQNNTTF